MKLMGSWVWVTKEEELLLWKKEFKEWNGDAREEGEDEDEEDDEDKVWLGKEKKKPRWLVLLGFMMFCGSSNKLIPWFIVPISLPLFFYAKAWRRWDCVRVRERVLVLVDIWFDFWLRQIQSIHVSVSININVGKRKVAGGSNWIVLLEDLHVTKILNFFSILLILKNNTNVGKFTKIDLNIDIIKFYFCVIGLQNFEV